jgi:hypothetical protein
MVKWQLADDKKRGKKCPGKVFFQRMGCSRAESELADAPFREVCGF